MPRPNNPSGLLAFGIVAALVAALVVHPVLGWEWTVLAGALGGWVATRRSWLAGALGVGLSWGAFIAWSFLVDARAVGEMTRVVAVMLGDLPPPATVLLTVLVGGLLGGAGGVLGGGLRNILRPVSR